MTMRQNPFSTASKSYGDMDLLVKALKPLYPVTLGPDLARIPDRLTRLG